MTIEKKKADGQLTVSLEGRLDTTAAPLFEESLRGELDGVACLVLVMAKLEYLSSAGLRVILAAQKHMSKKGKLVLKQVPEVILEILDVTGFIDILTVEN